MDPGFVEADSHVRGGGGGPSPVRIIWDVKMLHFEAYF